MRNIFFPHYLSGEPTKGDSLHVKKNNMADIFTL